MFGEQQSYHSLCSYDVFSQEPHFRRFNKENTAAACWTLNADDKMLGFYWIGHAAMGALLKLGVPEDQVFQPVLDPWDKETAVKFAVHGWQS